ncbi:hypothetical protein [Pseudonocardia broussonetiae]|uniref:Protein RecA n=1 Tax=Pseudonocardia broussonetiae TaxID=2736640 RepID=A0A6M6JH94_9PSEU|nr:hypothetical protein [Pseudonocardia broussonetiae]QJY46555.1 hypothetical protein HOP40_12635 [Pseudonocardia broussonetiae]
MAEVAVRGAHGEQGRGDVASRLALARGLLRGAEDRAAGVRPVAAVESDDRVLPVVEPLAGLLLGGGLRRGSTVALAPGPGSTSLLLGLVGEASAQGAWVGVVGRPELGLVAAVEAGVVLERLALVPHPGRDLLAVTVALLDGMDVVAVPGAGVRAGDRQRLAARARQRGAVLLALGPWPGADVELGCADVQWQGLEAGAGRLCSRRIRVRAAGRGLGPGRTAGLVLPADGGGVGGERVAPAARVEAVAG